MEQNMMKELISISILEKDSNEDLLLVWTYPDIEEEIGKIIVNRSGLQNDIIPLKFHFSKFKNYWFYTFIHILSNENNENNKEVKVMACAISLVTNEYHPEKYIELCKIMTELYYKNERSPIKILEFAKGTYKIGGELLFNNSDYDPRSAYLASSIRDIIRLFGEEIIFVWSALLIKKRIVVYCEKLSILLKLIRGFPLFVWHRQNWNILRPFMTLSDLEIEDLKTAGIYCAGFTDSSIKEKEELFDVLVDVNNRTISLASHASENFLLTPIHKDICQFLIKSSEQQSDQEIIKELTLKTKELISKLESLKVKHEDGNSYIDMQGLSQTELAPNVDKFLYAIATAEGMTKL